MNPFSIPSRILPSLFVALTCLLTISCTHEYSDEGGSEGPYWHGLYCDLRRACREVHSGTRLRGEIVDQSGNPAPTLTLIVEEARGDSDDPHPRVTTRPVLVTDGQFNIHLSPCHSAAIILDDPLYDPIRLKLPGPIYSAADFYHGMLAEGVLPPTESGSGVRLRIGPRYTYTTLRSGGLHIERPHKSDGSGYYIDFSAKEPRERTIANVTDTTTWPPNAMMVVAARNPDGSFKSIAATRLAYLFHGNPPPVYPADCRLVMSGPDSGIQWAPSGTKLDDLPTAPLTGYAQEIHIDELIRFWEAREAGADYTPVGTFFFKSGGRYGKGKVPKAMLSPDCRELHISIGIDIQPDGSPNLRVRGGTGF